MSDATRRKLLGEDIAEAAAKVIGKPLDLKLDPETARRAIDAPEPARPVRNANGECVHCGQIEGQGPHGPDCVWTPL